MINWFLVCFENLDCQLILGRALSVGNLCLQNQTYISLEEQWRFPTDVPVPSISSHRPVVVNSQKRVFSPLLCPLPFPILSFNHPDRQDRGICLPSSFPSVLSPCATRVYPPWHCPWLYFLFWSAVLRYDSHTIKCANLRCAIRWIITATTIIIEHFHDQNQVLLKPLCSQPPLPNLQSVF